MATLSVGADAKRAKHINTSVVTIHGRESRRRRNRPEDAATISLRRILTTTEAVAFGEQNAEALALSWAMARKLPCNNLRLIAGTLDERRDFEVRLAEVALARAEREVAHARALRAKMLHGEDARVAMLPECERAFERLRRATLDMARSAVFSKADLRRKKAAIGTVWLGAEGAWYDQLRAALVVDEARLGGR
jgi:hypothetical protein